MNKHALCVALLLAVGSTAFGGGQMMAQTSTPPHEQTQAGRVSGTVTDRNGNPLIGASVMVKGTHTGVVTDINGKFSIAAKEGQTLEISYVGYSKQSVRVGSHSNYDVTLSSSTNLDEVVVTAMGVSREKKSLTYAIDEIDSEELMRNKSTNVLNSLSGKMAGVNITQASGAAGAGTQIILRGGTSLERDNQPLFVVDGVIYDNSTSIVGNSAFDGMMATATTNSNRVMDINPEDIESMSVLKGPAASALYGSRAAAGVVIITTKKGEEGNVEVNLNAKYITSWAKNLPYAQKTYKRGYYDESGALNSYTTQSWGARYGADDKVYDNIGDFFQSGGAWDTNLSVSGGNKNGNFYLSGSFYDQDGIIPTTGYKKTTFRFNGEQKYKMFTFNANVAYSQANTDKTLTSAGLYGSGGTGSMVSVYRWSPSDNMSDWIKPNGDPVRMFEGQQSREDDIENPYWMLNKYKFTDETERFTGSFSIKADITDWLWVQYRMGMDSYTTENRNIIGENSAVQVKWQNGMLSENSYRYRYLSTNLMINANKQFGDFGTNLLIGTSTDNTKTATNYRMGWNFQVPGFYSFSNVLAADSKFQEIYSKKRLVGVYGELRLDWRSALFLTFTARNDWSSTLPVENRSYFYPSVGGGVVFTEFMPKNDIVTFGKVRASWARVGKDANPYVTNTYMWPVGTYLGDRPGVGQSWTRGNPYLKPETTESTEIGLEMRFFNDRLRLDYAFYTNNSLDQIVSPRLSQANGYIMYNANTGDVYNKGMELLIGGTPVQTKDWTWETSINLSGNRGTVENLTQGMDILYVTDAQVGTAKAASFNNGKFMGISGSKWQRDPNGNVILNDSYMPVVDSNTALYVGDREPNVQGGWNNTLSWERGSFGRLTFNMLWEFRFGGMVYNGTEYFMTNAGLSEISENRESITIKGVQQTGTDAKGNPIYTPAEKTFTADGTYNLNGAQVSGRYLIQNYYQNYYSQETANFLTEVNSLRLRTISLTWELPSKWLEKTKVFKRASISVTGNNLLLFTNYNGDPELAVAGSGAVGSSSVGIDYCGVPSTASVAFGVNLTF